MKVSAGWAQRSRVVFNLFRWCVFFLFFLCSGAAGCHSQTGSSAAAAERHQRGSEEPAAPHAHQPPAGQAQGQTLLTAVLQPPQVVGLPKPYDA